MKGYGLIFLALVFGLALTACNPTLCNYNDLYVGQKFTVDEKAMYHTWERWNWSWHCEQHHATHVVSVSDSSTIVGVWSW